MVLKMTLRNNLKVLSSAFYILLTTALVLLLIAYFKGFEIVFGTLYIVLSILGVILLPCIYLHIEYFIVNAGEVFKILPDSLTIYKNGKETIIAKENIELIITYPSMKGSNQRKPPWDDYNYARIITKDGKEFIITCLFSPHISGTLGIMEGIPRKVKRYIFPSIFNP